MRGAEEILRLLKDGVKAAGFPTGAEAFVTEGKRMLRTQNSGCHELCEMGPVVMLYPEGEAYRLQNAADVARFIERRLLHKEVLPDLLITPEAFCQAKQSANCPKPAPSNPASQK